MFVSGALAWLGLLLGEEEEVEGKRRGVGGS